MKGKVPKKVAENLDKQLKKRAGTLFTRGDINNWLIETGLGMGGDRDARSAVDAFFRSGKPAFSNALKRKAERDKQFAELEKVEKTIEGQLQATRMTADAAVQAAGVKSKEKMLELTATLSASPAVQSAVDDTVKNLMDRPWWKDRSFPITFGPEGAPDLGIPNLSGQTFQTKTQLKQFLNDIEVKKFLTTYGLGGLPDTTGFTAKRIE